MARKWKERDQEQVGDYRHDEARRRNNPPAGIAPTYEVRERRATSYAYDPHLDPQLQWAGKAEHTSFDVDVVSLHIHERISTKAILNAVRRPEPLQLTLFGETPLPPSQQIEFYQHEIGWANRLMLGDSLLVMNSLLVKEGMAGKVQMIYVDPPYGIKYASNFQPRTDRRDVKDQDDDLTPEPEQIKAYRDTWKLGIHSYLTYLRDRLLLAKDLLHPSGSIFVQINDENLHLVRSLLDEVFGRENFVRQIVFEKTGVKASGGLDNVYDTLVWYAKDKDQLKYRALFLQRAEVATMNRYNWLEMPDGASTKLTSAQISGEEPIPEGRRWQDTSLFSQGESTGETAESWVFNGEVFHPKKGRHWATRRAERKRLAEASRVEKIGTLLRFRRFADDFPVVPLTDIWRGTMIGRETLYSVQTPDKVIERCVLMTTDPGDLVFDPTCVRKGTRVWAPLNPPDIGGTSTPSPLTGRAGEGPPSPMSGRVGVGLLPIEAIQPGDLVLGHDGKPHRVLRTIRKPYQGTMVGIQHRNTTQTLWVTADHYVLCQKRTLSYGAERTWRHVPKEHFGRARTLRREMTPAEQRLWSALRGEQLGVKFRRQHPIGPYIADFYSWEAGLVVEMDGDSHFTPEAQDYDCERDAYLSALGLTVLRFTNQDIMSQKEEVLSRIVETIQQVKPSEDHYKQWRRADSLRVGDVVYLGPEQQPVEIANLLYEETREEVYDLEVEGGHSFLTEVCAVHNCGSGTTAYCAEKWGRRWSTCDTSRVALAIARQRLMTAKYDYYELADPERGPAGGFIYEIVPHITLESIARNTELDAIAAKYQPQIDETLAELNRALGKDWKEWEVPRELSPLNPPVNGGTSPAPMSGRAGEGFPAPMSGRAGEGSPVPMSGRVGEGPPAPMSGRVGEGLEAHECFWSLKRKMRHEIDASIQRNAPQETLYDRPQVRRGVVRVSGPFTVEAIPVPAVEDPTQVPIPQFEEDEARTRISDRGGDYLTTMLNLLKQQGGVLFPGGKKMELQNLRLLNLGLLHAEGETPPPQPSPASRGGSGRVRRAAISFGPRYGPVTATQVAEAIPTARNNAYEVLIFAGFSFDPEAQAFVQRAPVKGLEVHFANIAPEVLVGDLLKTTRASQIFTVFGQPDVRISPSPLTGRVGEGDTPLTGRVGVGDTYTVELRGVDIYDPLTGETQHARGSDVAAWFLDTDYDGMTFHICQAFFPGDADAWDKIQRALRATIDPEAFEQMRGTVSFPFEPGKHRRIAVKVIDFRGNEVVRVVALDKMRYPVQQEEMVR
jgi:adenine-specific DNA-methyltransferase